MSDSYWCERALLDGVVRDSVRVVIDDGRFSAVLPDAAAEPGDSRLSGVTIPGLANAHSHAFHRALRSRAQRDGGTFWAWRDVMYRAAGRLDPDRYHALARGVFGEMVGAGVTCVGEFHYVHHQQGGAPYDDPNAMGEALLAAAAEAGLRITLLDTLYLHGGLADGGYVEPNEAQRRFSDGSVDAWIARVEALDATHHALIGAAVHSVRAVDPAAIAAAAEWASTAGAPLHAHVSEQVAENDRCLQAHGVTPTRLLADAGALTGSFTAVHATHLTGADVELLADSTVCMCPTTERDLGDGIGPTGALVAAGTAISLGSDSHAVIDILEEARAVELDERLRSMRRGVHQPRELLAAATLNGHRCLGWHDAGAIAVGARADLVTINLGSPRTAGAGDRSTLEAVVFAATAGDVTSVVIDGRRVLDGGRHTAIDVPRTLTDSINELMED